MHGNEWFTTQSDTENMLKLQLKNMFCTFTKNVAKKNAKNKVVRNVTFASDDTKRGQAHKVAENVNTIFQSLYHYINRH